MQKRRNLGEEIALTFMKPSQSGFSPGKRVYARVLYFKREYFIQEASHKGARKAKWPKRTIMQRCATERSYYLAPQDVQCIVTL